MRLLPALLLALTVSATTACAQHATPTKSAPKITKVKAKKTKKAAAAQAQTAPVLVFKRTPCFGTCPDYDATIYADGRVQYEGRSNVSKVGTHELKLPAATVRKVLADAQRLGFAQLNDRYAPKTVTDLPSTFLSVRQPNGQLKTVQVEGPAPAGLQELFDYLSAELDKAAGNAAPAGR
ncbi:DUF6438 domain-containing protein [Hymenobacter persicinus]|uniref:DUF6438 domain-containing protein n=1 Tax=Hymenobacter persicinus TaxID=2025506 RepID=A0A4Q5LCV1_9BACT|nr:DUF6438 domain-containing protein [Hymenobacter persicinus]RYU79170.1 hypothetical protein EWM57_11605 [Hymenobacter persicinus]